MEKKISLKGLLFFLAILSLTISIVVANLQFLYRQELSWFFFFIMILFLKGYVYLSYREWAYVLRQKKTIRQYLFFAYPFIWLGILVLVYAVLRIYPYQIDLTKTGIYSLSKKSKDILAELQSPVQIIVWDFGSTDNYIDSLLKNYKQKNSSYIDIRYIKVDYSPHIYKLYNKNQYQQISLTIKDLLPLRKIPKNEWDKFKLSGKEREIINAAYTETDGFFVLNENIKTKIDRLVVITEIFENIGYASKYFNISSEEMIKSGGMMYRTGNEIPVYAEKEITNKIEKLSSKDGQNEHLICNIIGHGEKSFETSYKILGDTLKNEFYAIKEVYLTDEKSLENCKIVVIAGPVKPYFKNEIDNLKKYLLKDEAKFLLLVDPEFQYSTQKNPIDVGLSEILSEYSIEKNPGFLYDLENITPIRIIDSGYIRTYIYQRAVYDNHQIVKDLINSGIKTIFLGIKTFKFDEKKSKYKVRPFLKSSENSWLELTSENDQQKNDFDANDIKGSHYFGLALEGKENSQKKFILIGDSDFVANHLVLNDHGKDLFLNTISWLSDQQDKITIQPKKADSGIVFALSAESIKLLVILFIFGIPGVFILLGYYVYRVKKTS